MILSLCSTPLSIFLVRKFISAWKQAFGTLIGLVAKIKPDNTVDGASVFSSFLTR